MARVLDSLGELSKVLDHRHFLGETAIEMFLENSCTFYGRQIILLNIVILILLTFFGLGNQQKPPNLQK